MKLKDKIFSCDEVNTNRQNELDLARAFIIFCLAFIHVTIECTSDEGLCSGIPYLFDTVIGGPFSAPMYMFVMGVGMCYAKKHKPRDYFIRGFNIFVLGYILNICRYTIPYTIGYAITGDYAVYIEPLLYKTLFNDIFTFAGLAMMIIALFKKLKFSNLVMFVIAFVMCIFGELLNGVDVGNPIGNIFLGYLFYRNVRIWNTPKRHRRGNPLRKHFPWVSDRHRGCCRNGSFLFPCAQLDDVPGMRIYFWLSA